MGSRCHDRRRTYGPWVLRFLGTSRPCEATTGTCWGIAFYLSEAGHYRVPVLHSAFCRKPLSDLEDAGVGEDFVTCNVWRSDPQVLTCFWDEPPCWRVPPSSAELCFFRGSRQRSEDEMQQPGRLGGGFSSYGGRGPRDRDDSGGGRRPYGGGFDDERRGDQSRVSDFPQASRADEDDDWGKAKKLQSFDQGRHGRYSGLGGGGGQL
ncbi:hypothetical protein F2Q68_00010727 [Brassica cretica]|uniref:Uncharacterized protein n=1 Tax=Brassica cretica TaxID=69181 RepID=A0A8S9KYF1_BRACR|nr:hypothetical protein F2Q68_00010727 [Brassica cretica]